MGSRFNLKSNAYIDIDDELWFFSIYFNGLIRLNKSTGRIIKIYRSPSHYCTGRFTYSDIHYYAGRLYLIPNLTLLVAVFDIEHEQYSYIQLSDEYGFNEGTSIGAIRYGDELVLVPSRYKAFCSLNLKSSQIEYFDLRNTDAFNSTGNDLLFRNYYVEENKVYLPVNSGSGICIYDLVTNKLEIEKCEINNGATIECVDDRFYIASQSENLIYEWDRKTKTIRNTYSSNVNSFSGRYFIKSVSLNDYVLFFPHHGDRYIVLNVDENSIYDCLLPDSSKKEQFSTYYAGVEGNKTVWLAGQYVPNELKIKDDAIDMIPICNFDSDYNSKVLSEYYSENNVFLSSIEKNGMELEDFVEYMIRME